VLFERGFKAWCERTAQEMRRVVDVRPSDPLDPAQLAPKLGIEVRTARDVLGLSDESSKVLFEDDSNGWSALTICVGARRRVILNPTHSPGRQASDLMHELSHLILNHNPNGVGISQEGLLLMDQYDRKQEAEADWLAGCLLLPRDALVSIKKRFLDLDSAARAYGVSRAMLRYRFDITGVNYQFA
jgi:IrrE N-terminal-like domain